MSDDPRELPRSDEAGRHAGKLADMVMLALPGGEERTAAEYRVLLERAGFRLTQVVPTETPASIVEAVVA